jgi:hypothetical protein
MSDQDENEAAGLMHMQAATRDDVYRQSQILAMRTLADGQSAINRTLERMTEALASTREEVAGLKAQNTVAVVERLTEKLDAHMTATAATLSRQGDQFMAALAEERAARLKGDQDASDKHHALALIITSLKEKVLPMAAGVGVGVAVVVSALVERALS